VVDFSEAIKERVGAMSSEELAATEAKRRSRETETVNLATLPARWEPASGDAGSTTTKSVAVKVDPTPGPEDVLRFSEGSAFQESIILNSDVYRVLAGGAIERAGGAGEADRFVIHAGAAGYDRVCVDRGMLAALVASERPVEMARARRLVAMERRTRATTPSSDEEKIAAFARLWEADKLRAAVDTALAKVPSRTMLLLVGKDQVALWVRKEELVVGPEGVLASPLAEALVRPPVLALRPTLFVQGDGATFRDRDARFVQSTFGSGPTRGLVLDAAKLRDVIVALEPEPRQAALALLDRLIARSAELGADSTALRRAARLG
jgi:hypothetical protein